MLWSIDSCQNRISADLTSITWPSRGLKCRPIEVEYFFEVIRWQITSFKWSQAQVYFFQWFVWSMLCLSLWLHTVKILISNWPRTRKFSHLFRNKGGEDLFLPWSRVGHALVTLYVQFLYSDWSKCDRWVHAENLCSILKVVYFYSKSWQSFVSTCDVFNCRNLFPLDVQNEIQLLSRVFCYPWLVCLLGFLVEKCVACQNWVIRFRMASFSSFTLLNA